MSKKKRITTLEELSQAALERRSVYCPAMRWLVKPKPAAFVIGIPGHTLVRLFSLGLYLFYKQKKGSK